MISREELIALMGDLKSDRVQRIESTDNTEQFSQAVCAFANDLPIPRKSDDLVVGIDKFSNPLIQLEVNDRTFLAILPKA